MCGIFGSVGQVRWNPSIAAKSIRRRGPDDSGFWVDSNVDVMLGQVRLSIIDTSSAGHQPMHSKDGRIVMVYNGELYNFQELRSELEALGEKFSGHSDSEVFLAMFARYGIDCFSRFNGIYAAAFWDRETHSLTLVRDPMGVKPLYWAATSGGIVFASELKALLRSGAVSPRLNPEAILCHLSYLWSPGTATVVMGINKMLPGTAMQISNGEIASSKTYSDISFSQSFQGNSEGDLIKKVSNAVELAVQRQMMSDVPLGAFLSGGLDSSAIAAFAQKYLRQQDRAQGNLQCFSIEVKNGSTATEGFSEDLPYARKVADHLGVDLNVVQVGEDMMDRLAEMVYLLDEPTPDPAALNTLFISEFARSQGIKVLLSGAGGDDIFTGYRRHFALMQERWWARWPLLARQGLSTIAGALPTSNPTMRRIGKAFQNAGQDPLHRLAGYFQWMSASQALELLTPEFRSGLSEETLYAPMLKTLEGLPNGVCPLNQMLYLECKHFLADHNLNYADKMGMAAGVEIRVPLLDRDLVNLASSLPVEMKQQGATGKWIFKRAMEPYLPHNVIYRPKTGFGVPLRQWLQGILKPLVDDVLSKNSLSARGVFDVAAVESIVNADRAGRIDASYTILSIVCLELWCRQYIDGTYSIDPEI